MSLGASPGFASSRGKRPWVVGNDDGAVVADAPQDAEARRASWGSGTKGKVMDFMMNFNVGIAIISHPLLMVYTTHKHGDLRDGLLLLYQHYDGLWILDDFDDFMFHDGVWIDFTFPDG